MTQSLIHQATYVIMVLCQIQLLEPHNVVSKNSTTHSVRLKHRDVAIINPAMYAWFRITFALRWTHTCYPEKFTAIWKQ
jgi:hypothetical protein